MKNPFCRHNSVKIVRCHRESPWGREFWRKAGAIDKHGCLVVVRCKKCGKFLETSSEPLFDTLHTDSGLVQ